MTQRSECERCNGAGIVSRSPEADDGGSATRPCSRCEGTGISRRPPGTEPVTGVDWKAGWHDHGFPEPPFNDTDIRPAPAAPTQEGEPEKSLREVERFIQTLYGPTEDGPHVEEAAAAWSSLSRVTEYVEGLRGQIAALRSSPTVGRHVHKCEIEGYHKGTATNHSGECVCECGFVREQMGEPWYDPEAPPTVGPTYSREDLEAVAEDAIRETMNTLVASRGVKTIAAEVVTRYLERAEK